MTSEVNDDIMKHAAAAPRVKQQKQLLVLIIALAGFVITLHNAR